MSVSYGLVTSLAISSGSASIRAILAEGALFAASFALQNLLVFPHQDPVWGSASRARPSGEPIGMHYRKPAVFAPFTRKITERIRATCGASRAMRLEHIRS